MSTPSLQVRENQDWLADLRAASPEAIADLRAVLLRGLRAALAGRVNGDLDTISEDFVQEAVLKVLGSLDSFRGESRFLTWAQKIAIHVALSDLRRKRWKDVSLQEYTETPEGEEYTPPLLTDPGASPEQEAARRDLLRSVERLIMEELTDRQRTAMLAILQDGVPLQVVAERMGTNPNALYKLLHDARQRMKQRLEEQAGFSAQEALALFESNGS